ncbi:hypothetical protein WA026_020808 [Henosepilachna vigintioctopunctata]|uniref:Uncharacterized protein n=1 Tax=Henosepilachna vigintioctopunctata TaxID=420089 RepID=A0AAW1TY88_9CUCU
MNFLWILGTTFNDKGAVSNIDKMATEIKKMKQGMSYSCKEKTIILNVFKYFKSQHPERSITDLVRRTANATGCSEKSIFQFRKEEASAEGFKAPSKTKIRKNININSRDIKYDDSVRQVIRNIVYELKYKNIIPSLNTILKNIRLNNELPNFSLMTLRRLLFDMGFSYEKIGNKSILTEKPQGKQETQQKVGEKNVKLCKTEVNKIVNSRENNSNNLLHNSNQINLVESVPVAVNTYPKHTPQHSLNHINNNPNLHLEHPNSYQNHHHTSQAVSNIDNHSIIGSSVHPQAPLSHNVPMMLIYKKNQPHPPFLSQLPSLPSSSDLHYNRRDDFALRS